MTQGYVIDASSLFTLLFLTSDPEILSVLRSSFISDLTIYETGNILSKGRDERIKGLDRKKISSLSKEISNVLSGMNTVHLKPEDFNRVLSISTDRKLTYYDASYIFFSKELKLPLVTEDNAIRAAGKDMGIVVKIAEDLAG